MHFSHYSLKRHQDFVSLWQGETFINTTNTAEIDLAIIKVMAPKMMVTMCKTCNPN